MKNSSAIQKKKHKQDGILHLMMIPSIVITFVFCYVPLLGSIMAFQDFKPAKGFFRSKWVGLDNFKFVANLPGIDRVMWNTIYIALWKMVLGILVPLLFALLLNEVKNQGIKRGIQTLIYLPNFLSWVILSGIFIDILSPSTGLVNKFLGLFGVEPIYFLGDKFWFPITMIVTDVWKNFGFGSIIYLAALTGIDPTLYEAAAIDGATRFKQTIHVTLPGMAPIIVLMTVLSMGNILNAGFDQIFNMISASVYETGDILDFFIYRLGMQQQQFSPAAAVGLFRSVVSFIFVSVSYFLADKLANYRIF
ncbi:MAG: ABC transporter permease subunit [Oscillospiraceae bacterium]